MEKNSTEGQGTLEAGLEALALYGQEQAQTPPSFASAETKRCGNGTFIRAPRGKELQDLIFQKNARHPAGGLKWTDEEDLRRQRGVAWDVVKQIGSNIIEGKDLVSVSLPVYLFEPRSFLERLCDGFSFAPTYLTKAAATTDPLERLKNVIAFFIAGTHLTATQKKPFNPILGETYQATFSEDGTEVFAEQTTHHPPASNFQVIPQDGSYHFWGHGVFSAVYRGNLIKGYQTGPNYVDFPDGTRISIQLPYLEFKGLVMGDRIQNFAGNMSFVDQKNDLGCVLEFNPEAPSWLKSWFAKPKYPADYFVGDIFRLSTANTATSASNAGGSSGAAANDKKEVLSRVEGCWLSHLDFDSKRYWDLKEVVPSTLQPVDDPLPSDCRFRDDLQALLAGDFATAQQQKVLLEERQRGDARLRKEGAAARQGAGDASRSLLSP
ncbi:Oxysterol-binding protein 4 [Balamuthia mandrillaris]